MRILKSERRNVLRAACVLAAMVLGSMTTGASAAVNMDWVTVGNAGNAADPLNSGSVPGIGAVSYDYRIAKHEVTNAQYAEFLNTVAATDTNALYNTSMGSDARGGITRSGSSGSFTYSVKANMADKPVNYTSWYDAARFSNWMTNGQGAGSTESGVYTLTGPTTISGITRDLNDPNQVFIPTENEWYKAAYHQPADQGGDSDNYWLYPTASNSVPTIATATATGDIANAGTNVANYSRGADWNDEDGNVTTVGSAGPDSESFYGTSDQGGNVWEWNETLASGGARVIRGASWFGPEFNQRSSAQDTENPTDEGRFLPDIGNYGFRVASPVPEPTSLALVALGVPLLLRRRRG